ncbi:hypothetical protein G6F64_008384 [Rhizopus arrhizus]|uniref:Uncharacterized protein n=1 Tax=Rhizopus oryzae TaxID=64495 RepID=A0A9P7BQL2_RHIOR|nr:hypothetical protein G6F24_011324 [Rhizopus arrhizus]KAG1305432.1 hypothetical protein G6F64_008384 [Rhizopus arrhizus]
MSTDEQLKIVIQTLQEEIKHSHELNNELRINIDNQTKQQNELNNINDYLKQKITAMQMDNSNYSNIQARLETQIYSQEQELTTLKREIHQLSKAKKDAEKKLTLELQEFEKDKMDWQQREADLYNQIRALNIAEPRTPRRRSVTTLSPFGLGDIEENKKDTETTTSLNVPKLSSPSYAREAKIAQRTIKAQDKLIADLKMELDKQRTIVQEHKNQIQNQSLRMEHLEYEIANVKQLNCSLMEDNESYQILLHEKTVNGEFMMNPIMQVHDSSVIMKESNSSSSSTVSNGLNLAAELNMASDWNQKDQETTIQKLNDEIKKLEDTIRALQLYMNKILMKVIDNKQLEDVLSIDQPKKEEKPVTPVEPKITFDTNTTKPTQTVGRPRRRTISYWGSKSNNPTPLDTSSQIPSSVNEMDKRRHSSIIPSENLQPEKSTSTTLTSGNSGWAKALRRMSMITWGSKGPMLGNDNTVFSSSEEDSIMN